MKNTPFMIILLCVGAVFGDEPQLPSSQRIYSQMVFEVTTPGWIWGEKTVQRTNLITGTFWVVQDRDSPFIITAAHNLGLGPRGTPRQIGNLVIGKENRLTAVKKEVVLGTMGYKPSSFALIGLDTDITLLKTEQEAYMNSKQLRISDKPPVVGQTVTVNGYPGTSHEKVQSSKVVAVYSKHFVLYHPVDHGYSGGVVLNDQGEAMGMINATDKKEATALLVTKDIFRTAVWKKMEGN